jgi:excisionase family DNA binding protein
MKDCRLSNLPDVLTVDQAARFLGIGRNSAYEAVRRGELPHIKVGRSIRVSRAGLKRMLNG